MLCVLVEVSLRRDQNFGPADAGRILLLENCQCLQVDAQGGRREAGRSQPVGPWLGLVHSLQDPLGNTSACSLSLPFLSCTWSFGPLKNMG